jgi:hypothetical protein
MWFQEPIRTLWRGETFLPLKEFEHVILPDACHFVDRFIGVTLANDYRSDHVE